MTISLGRVLLRGSSERPLPAILRPQTLALAPERVCHELSLPTAERTRRTICIAPPVRTFHVSSTLRPTSIVSVALSLGFRKWRDTCSFHLLYIPAAVNRFRFPPPCDGFGARTFLPRSCEQRRSSVLPSDANIAEIPTFGKVGISSRGRLFSRRLRARRARRSRRGSG